MRHLLLPLFLGSLGIISKIIAALVSIYLRFDGNLIPQNYLSMLVGQLPFFVMITIVSFFYLNCIVEFGDMQVAASYWQ